MECFRSVRIVHVSYTDDIKVLNLIFLLRELF
nr:MAG TPA: hypothetical protein [Caudoviricetes sp.]